MSWLNSRKNNVILEEQKGHHCKEIVLNENGPTYPLGPPTAKKLTSTDIAEYGTCYNDQIESNAAQNSTQNGTNSAMVTKLNAAEESGINYSQLSRNKKCMLILSALVFFITGCGYSIMAPFFTKEAVKKGMSLTMTSFIFSVLELVSLMTTPILGSYLKRLGPNFVCLSGIFVEGACTMLFGVVNKCPPGTSFVVITLFCRTVWALGYAASLTSVTAILSNEFPEYVSSCVALLLTSIGIGMMVGPAIGGVMYELGGFGLPFYVIGVVTLLIGALIYVLMPTVETLTEEKEVSLFTLMRSPMIVIPMFCISTGAMGISFLDPTLANHLEPFGLRVSIVGLCFTLPSLLFPLVSPLLGFLSDKKGIYTYPIVIGHFVFGMGFLFIGPSDILPFLPFKLWTELVGLFLVGISFSSFMVSTMKCMIIGSREMGLEENIQLYGVLSGILNSMYSLGAFTGPMAGGILAQYLGYSMAYTVMGLWSIYMSIVTFIFFAYRYLRNKTNYNVLS